MRRRVVISGAGVICSVGEDLRAFWENCLNGKTCVSRIPHQWLSNSDYRSKIWSPLPMIDFAQKGFSRLDRLQMDLVTILALSSAQEALHNAHLTETIKDAKPGTYELSGVESSKVGVFMGTGVGGANSFLENHCHSVLSRGKNTLTDILENGMLREEAEASIRTLLDSWYCPKRINPFIVSMLMPNAVSAALGLKYSLKGPNLTFAGACAAGTIAIGKAYRAIRDGVVDMALCGGSEYLCDRFGYIFRGFDVAGTLATARDYQAFDEANRPFDADRSGFLFSEGGAAVLVLEEASVAQERDAPILAEVVSYAETFDAHSIMSLEPGGKQIERMIRIALRDASLKPDDIQYVNAHGTGTQNNDNVESLVLERVFGNRAHVNSTKSIVGHTIGASGAIEAAVAALSIRDQTTHVSRNIENPVRDLNYVEDVRSIEICNVLSQSFAFGGHNAGLILRRFNG